MARYRKKPVVIEAIQWDGRNFEEISNFVGSALDYYINDCAWRAGAGQPVRHLTIKTLEGDMNVNIGDYIIKGVRGEFYPCKPDIFKETYEAADADGEEQNDDVARLKTEIQELTVRNERQRYAIKVYQINETRSEAIKEFATRFENAFSELEALYDEEGQENLVPASKVLALLDALVNERTEKNNEH